MDRTRQQLDIFGVLQKRIAALEADVALLRNQNLALPNWINIGDTGAPAWQGGCSNYGYGFDPTGFWKDSGGVVYLRGLVAGANTGDVIFTLPLGFRPDASYTHIFMTINNDSIGRVDVQANGYVLCANLVGGAGWISLNGISFRAES